MTCLMDVPTGCVVGAQIRTHLVVELGYMITIGYSHASWFRPAPKETMGGKGLSQDCPFSPCFCSTETSCHCTIYGCARLFYLILL